MIAKSQIGQEIERALDNYKQIKDEIETNPDRNNPDLIKRYLEVRQRLKGLSIAVDTISALEEEIKKISLQNDVYVFKKEELIKTTTQEYRDFLKESGYADLDSCSKLVVGKNILKWNQNIRDLAGRLNLQYNNQPLTGNDGEYVVNINQTDGRRLVENLGGRLLTTRLMYGLFIPYIKQEAQNGNPHARKTLDEMIQTKAEWLEDLIKDRSRLKINGVERNSAFQLSDGEFNRTDLNPYGYPTKIAQEGEFLYWFPRPGEMAVVRGRGSDLGLSCSGGPSDVGGSLGVRLAKFF